MKNTHAQKPIRSHIYLSLKCSIAVQFAPSRDLGINVRSASSSATRFIGDFNLDGKINGDDYTLIDNAYNTQSATPLATIAAPTNRLAPASAAPMQLSNVSATDSNDWLTDKQKKRNHLLWSDSSILD
jgi:hypothetical protein